MWASKTYSFSPSTTVRSAEVNTNFDDMVDALNEAMPASATGCGIILFSGSIANIPSGWYLCNGSNGTPDLRDRFVVGAGNSYAVGATGGEATHTLSNAELPAHTHTGTTGSTSSNHSHTGTTDNISVDHSHTFSGTTSGESGHTHVPLGSDAFWCYDSGGGETNENLSAGSITGKKNTTGASSGHTHTYSGTTSGVSTGHTHTFTTGGHSADHLHSFTTGNGTGGGGAHENRPPYYGLAYIMKAY